MKIFSKKNSIKNENNLMVHFDELQNKQYISKKKNEKELNFEVVKTVVFTESLERI